MVPQTDIHSFDKIQYIKLLGQCQLVNTIYLEPVVHDLDGLLIRDEIVHT